MSIEDDERPIYRIVRIYQDASKPHRTIERGVTLAEAQAHCQDPETSSTKATGAKARRITKRAGCDWFDGYELDLRD
jgi:hypothetical protein